MKNLVIVLLAVAVFAVPALAQDDCASAVVAVQNGAGALLDPDNDATPTWAAGSCTTGNGTRDNWAQFVATATAARVRTDLNSVGTDSHYVVLSGACGAQVEIGCSEDEVGPYLGDISIGGLTVGSTYYVQLGTWGDSASGTYTVDVEDVPGGVCGDNLVSLVPGAEECDGTDDSACTVGCQVDCTCENLPVPALPVWGLVGIGVLLAGGGTTIFRRRK